MGLLVSHNGKRYRFHAPLTVGQYEIQRYTPLEDKDGVLEPNDYLIWVTDTIATGGIEFDESEARQLSDDIELFENHDISESELIARIDRWFKNDLQ
jgi:hypothetical protein